MAESFNWPCLRQEISINIIQEFGVNRHEPLVDAAVRRGTKPLHAPSLLVFMEHTMRSIFLSPAISCAVIGSAAADAPFAPVANVPDYVVTMVERPGDYSRRVSHHGDWTRVDRMEGSNHFSTKYFSANGLAAIHIYSPLASVSFERGGERSPYADTEPRRTGEAADPSRRKLHGLGCAAGQWRASQWRSQPHELHHRRRHRVMEQIYQPKQRDFIGGSNARRASASRAGRRPAPPRASDAGLVGSAHARADCAGDTRS